MAEKWQQWMPFHIDRFMGSRHVQMMHPVARIAYLYLLSSQWQSDDCTISADEDDLSILSGVGDLWLAYQKQVLRQFAVLPDGRLRNEVCFEEWETARDKYIAFQVRGSKGGKGKVVTSNVLEVNLSQQQATTTVLEPTTTVLEPTPYLTVPNQTIQEAKATPLAPSPKAGIVAVASPKFMDLPTHRQGEFFTVTETNVEGWTLLYPAADIRQQVRNIRGWLDSNPGNRKTLKGMPRFVNAWLSKAQNQAPRSSDGTQPSSTGTSGNRGAAVGRVERSLAGWDRAAERRGISNSDSAPEANAIALPTPGVRGDDDRGISLRLREAGGEIRAVPLASGLAGLTHPARAEVLSPTSGRSGSLGGYGGTRAQ